MVVLSGRHDGLVPRPRGRRSTEAVLSCRHLRPRRESLDLVWWPGLHRHAEIRNLAAKARWRARMVAAAHRGIATLCSNSALRNIRPSSIPDDCVWGIFPGRLEE